MGRTKITLTLDEFLIEALDQFSVTLKKSRSRLVEEAVEAWRRKQMERSLIQGYKTMAREDAETAEAHLSAGTGVSK